MSNAVIIEAERALISAVLVSDSAFRAVGARIRPESFLDSRHQTIWSAFERMSKASVGIDAITLAADLEAAGCLERVGREYIMSVFETNYTSENALDYALIVAQASERRRWVATFASGSRLAADPGVSIAEIAAHVQREVEAITKDRPVQAKPIREVVSGVFTDLLSGKGIPRGVPTGFPRLDAYTGGLRPGQFIIIGARPSVGKTSMALCFGLDIALRQERRVAFFSLEMNAREIGISAIAAVSGVAVRDLAEGRLEEEDRRKLLDAAQRLSTGQLLIQDEGRMTVASIRADALALHQREPLALIIVDYLQLIPEEANADYENVQTRISAVSRSLKQLARDLNVPVMLLCQLNREIEKREGGVPQLSDLRDSGSLEQDGDLIFALHRPISEDEKPVAKTMLHILKQRTGPRGVVVPLLFHKAQTQFEEDSSFDTEEDAR